MMRTSLVIFLLLVAMNLPAKSQDSLVVTKQVAPEKYPPAARAVRASGEVRIEVTIGSDGRVVSVNPLGGHPLLRAVSLEAAKKWEFSPLTESKKEMRTANIFFNFGFGEDRHFRKITSSEKEEESGVRASFPMPFVVEAVYETVIPKLLLLPRHDGKVIPRSCSLHEDGDLPFEVQKKCDFDPEKTGYLREIFQHPAYNEVEPELFPWANEIEYYGLCDSTTIEEAEVNYCEKCRLRRKAWLAENDR